jgi:NMD protein affecting ribosome stability and mRNA decay
VNERLCAQCGAPEGAYVKRLWDDPRTWMRASGPESTSTQWTMSVPVALHKGLCQTCNRLTSAKR